VRGYLLDTGIFLLSVGLAERLNRDSRRLLESADNELFLSAASSWEISIKLALGKLTLPEPASLYVPKRLIAQGIRSLQITHIHALMAGELPGHHQDPFDRMLIAQAFTEDLVLMTNDRQFEKYKVETLWCGK
jgi:PIN domain nuclease of toxin-antitoxin system